MSHNVKGKATRPQSQEPKPNQHTPGRLDPLVLRDWCASHWGLKLERCGGPGSLKRINGAWKTGWMLSGHFPGFRYSFRHYRTLKQIAKVTEFTQNDEIELQPNGA